MKKSSAFLVSIIVNILLPKFSTAQYNHVPNGSFEYYTVCNGGIGEPHKASSWGFYNNSSADYYNSCNNRVPSNTTGYQHAAHGQAYMGGISFRGSTGNVKEYFEAAIIPLQPYVTYQASMSVSLADTSYYGTNDLGMFFYDVGPDTFTTSYYPNITAQVMFLSYGTIIDTQNWSRLIDTFVADSTYRHIVIGGFLHDSLINVDTIKVGSATLATRYAYYLFDSIVVKALDSFSVIFNDTMLCAGDTIQIKYITPEQYGVNNVFTAQLSNSLGSFANPVNIGSKTTQWGGFMTCIIPANTGNGNGYRIRVVSSSSTDTSRDNMLNIRVGNIGSSGSSTGTNSPVCAGNTLTVYAASSVSGTTYAWLGPNGFNTTTANNSLPNSTTTMSGDYYVTLFIHGCILKDTVTALVNPSPAAPIAGSNTPLCTGQTLNLTAATTTGGVSWSWAGPNSYTGNTQNPSITSTTTAMSGDYIVSATLNNCSSKDTVTVLVKPLPTAVTTGSNSPLCAGAILQLTASNSTTGATYAWTGPNSFTDNTQNTGITNSTAAATGWYIATVNLNGCTTKDSVFATVNAIPAAPVAIYNNPLCVGQTLSLSATNVTGATYSWTGIGGYTANTQNPTRSNMQFGDTGMYNVTAIVNGCTSSAGQVRVGINPSPFVVILANPGDSVCTGNPVVFTALPNNHGGTPLYQWYVNNSPVTTGSLFNTAALANGDVVRCDMTENTKCSTPYTDASNDITMNVLPWLAPTVSFTANPNRPLSENEFVTFTATSTNAGASPTYQWKRNGQNVQGATSSVWSANTLNDNDDICVEVISSYKCPQPPTAMSSCVKVKVLSGIGDIENNNSIKVYPNPVKGTLRITSTTVIETITINNLLGQQLLQQTTNGNTADVDMSAFAAGVYVVKVNGVYAVRVTKE